MFKKILVLALLSIGFILPVSADNNIVKTLPVQTVESGSSFVMPLTGYIMVSNVQTPELSLSDSNGNKRTVKVRKNAAFFYLEPGSYVVHATGVTVKKVGANHFFSMVGTYDSDEMAIVAENLSPYGRYGMFIYNWKFLRENVLDVFPTVNLNSVHSPEIDEWIAEGRMIFANTGSDKFNAWDERLNQLPVHGITLDEFVIPGLKNPADYSLGYDNPGLGFTEEHYTRIRQWLKNHPDKFFYPWLGIPWNADCRDLKPLYEVVTSAPNGVIMWEAYLHSRKEPTIDGLDYTYTSRARRFKEIAGDFRNFIIAPATYEYMDNNAAVDFKVHLDYQFHLMATDPIFENLRGIGMWVAYYTEPEILRWYVKLMKHYAIDGETTLLSEKYGFKLHPGIVRSPEWENAEDWSFTGAASIIHKKETGLPHYYLPRSSGNLLRLERTMDENAGASQVLSNLEPGKLYMVKTLCFSPDSPDKNIFALDIKLENAEIISSDLRYLQEFMRTSPHVWNARKIVFRAGDKPVKLTICESSDPGLFKPAVIVVDSVQVTPYLAE